MDSDISEIKNSSLEPTNLDFKTNKVVVSENYCNNGIFIFVIVSILILLVCFGIAYPEAGWYQELNNYTWSTNMLIMGIILAVIVIIMSICTGFAYRDAKEENKPMILFTFVASLLVLVMWFYVFYNAKNLDNSFYLGILFFFIAFLQTYYVWKSNVQAGYGMILYMLWALFAVLVTWNISNTNVVDI